MTVRPSLLSILGVALVAIALRAQPPESSQDGLSDTSQPLLLLKSGKTLHGAITLDGDRYRVVTRETELYIRVSDVAAVCRDVEEAYARRRAMINPRSGDERLELAQWCIDRGLFGLAAKEIAEVYRDDDLNPRISLMERRLKAAMTEPKPPEKTEIPPLEPRLNDEMLEATARSVPHDVMQEFTTRIQPLLVNYCATAGCHGPRAVSAFKLERIYLNQPSDPRKVRMNLHAVLAEIDRVNPAKSPLLNAPLSPHGGAKKPLFTATNAEHYRQLAAWAVRTARTATPETAKNERPTTITPTEPALSQRLPLAVPETPLLTAPPESSVPDEPRP